MDYGKNYEKKREMLLNNKDKLTFTKASEKKRERLSVFEKYSDISDVAKELNVNEETAYGFARDLVYEIKQKILKEPTPITQVVDENSNTAVVAPSVNMDNYIPQTNGYIPRRLHGTSDIKLMQQLYDNRHYVLIVGETGCGKTHLVRELAFKNKVAYMRVNLNGATTPEDLVGQWIPNANTNVDSKYVWEDGVLTKFMRFGGVFVVDEINMAPADILSLFHSITDDERRLVLTQKDGEVIHSHPDFYLVATMNVDYEGTKPLNLALKDRFRIFELDYNPTVEKKLGVDEEFSEIADKLRKSEEIMTPVSTRDLIKFIQDREIYGEKLARLFFINNFEKEEKAPVEEIISLTLDTQEDDKSEIEE